MPVPLAEVGRSARMNLTFASQDGQTILCQAYCEIPFKITRVLNPRHSLAHLILMHCSAGLFGGDELECSIRVERGARVILTQQSATKVHPTLGPPSIQRHHLFVETGAELQLYLQPVIPFAGSSLMQSVQIDLEENARLVFWEGLMAGRIGRGERWQFQKLASETVLRLKGKPVYLERFHLPSGLERSDYTMGECNYLGTGLYAGDRASEFATYLHTAIPDAGVDMLAPKVAIMRYVSSSGPDFHRNRDLFCVRFDGTPGD